jgi:hypothetical protein
MGIPIIPVTVAGETFRLFFDTGTQVSYLQDDVLDTFASAGVMRDFYPGFGVFETETHNVPISLGPLVDLSCACSFALPTRTSAFPETVTLRFGRLPGLPWHVPDDGGRPRHPGQRDPAWQDGWLFPATRHSFSVSMATEHAIHSGHLRHPCQAPGLGGGFSGNR